MQDFKIVKRSKPVDSFRNKSAIDSFSLTEDSLQEEFVGSLDFPENWNVGCIVGNSGTGKTSIAKHFFSDSLFLNSKFDESLSPLDLMPEECSLTEIFGVFNSVGFSSVPAWVRPYGVLSNGQKMRVDLAFALLQKNEIIAFDEFTSVVDRTVARVGSFATQKSIRLKNKKFVAITCHFDVIEFLMPDWVFDTNTMTFYLNEKKNLILELKYSKQQISQSGRCLLSTTI